jgi:hypothetical protein
MIQLTWRNPESLKHGLWSLIQSIEQLVFSLIIILIFIIYVEDPQRTGLVFQKLPKHMRRRVMSRTSKRLPRRLREAHMQQVCVSFVWFCFVISVFPFTLLASFYEEGWGGIPRLCVCTPLKNVLTLVSAKSWAILEEWGCDTVLPGVEYIAHHRGWWYMGMEHPWNDAQQGEPSKLRSMCSFVRYLSWTHHVCKNM